MSLVWASVAILLVSAALSFWLAKRRMSSGKVVGLVAGCFGAAVIAAFALMILAYMVVPTTPVPRAAGDHVPDDNGFVGVAVILAAGVVEVGVVAALGSVLGVWLARRWR